jgi:hypothetical protein
MGKWRMKFIQWLLFHISFLTGLFFLYSVRFFLDLVFLWANIIGSYDLIQWCSDAEDSIIAWLDELDDDDEN